MIHFFCLLHAPDDDIAPVDYSYVRSVGEGRRRAQLQNIHPEQAPEAPILRSPQKVDEYGIPENPFAPQLDQQPPVRRSRAARNAAQVVSQPTFAPQTQPAANQPQFDPPVSPEIPDWLRVAQQNNFPLRDRPQGPRVQAAPRQPEPVQTDVMGRPMRRPVQPQAPSPYEAAGYPRHLLEEQRRLEREQAAQPVRRRHGAQYAQRPQFQPEPQPEPTGMSYPPPRMQQPEAPAPMQRAYMHQPRPQQPEESWQVETDEEELPRELPAWVSRVPWLGIAAFVAVLAAVILWIMGMNYDKQTQQVLEERAAQEAQIVERHPLRYQDLIAEKADKYNLSPAFVAAIMLNESSFRPEATAESTGARGLMQLMNDTAEWIHSKMDTEEPFSFDSMYDPVTNAEFGCWYLGYLSEMFRGDPVLVAAAFHAGQGEVRNWLNTAEYSPDGRTVVIDKIPFSDTRRYVTRVMNAYAAYLRIYYGG